MASPLIDALLRGLARPAAAADSAEEQLSGRVLLTRAHALGRRLAASGLTADEPVLVRMENRAGALCDLLAVWLAGGVVVPSHRRAPPEAKQALAKLVGNRFTVDGGEIIEDGAPPPARPLLAGACLVIFTSGSTGEPKGVVLSHDGLAGKLQVLQRLLGTRESDVTLLPLQLTFVFGLWVALQSLSAGGRLRLFNGYDAAGLTAALSDGATRIAAVPTLLRRLVEEPAASSAPELSTVMTGGEALPRALAERMARTWPGAGLFDLYGSTETGSCDFCLTAARQEDQRGSLGQPTAGVAYRLWHEDGRPADRGETGELQIKTPYGMSGYLDRPDLDATAFLDDFFRSGDLARENPEGRLCLVGRAKEIVSRGGNKIAPLEIERLFQQHPAVSAALACGLPDPEVGERLHLLVVAAEPLDPEALKIWAAERMERWKLPDRIHLGESLPVGRTGKADRAALAQRLLAQGETAS